MTAADVYESVRDDFNADGKPYGDGMRWAWLGLTDIEREALTEFHRRAFEAGRASRDADCESVCDALERLSVKEAALRAQLAEKDAEVIALKNTITKLGRGRSSRARVETKLSEELLASRAHAAILTADIEGWKKQAEMLRAQLAEKDAEIARLHSILSNPRLDSVCLCGPRRKEIVTRGDDRFQPRTGCLTCNNWDGPTVLREP